MAGVVGKGRCRVGCAHPRCALLRRSGSSILCFILINDLRLSLLEFDTASVVCQLLLCHLLCQSFLFSDTLNVLLGQLVKIDSLAEDRRNLLANRSTA